MSQKSNDTNFLLSKVYISFEHQCYDLQSSSFWQLRTNEDVPTFFSSAGSLQP